MNQKEKVDKINLAKIKYLEKFCCFKHKLQTAKKGSAKYYLVNDI